MNSDDELLWVDPRKDDFEERAAIMEYDGGLPRPAAERAARALVERAQRANGRQTGRVENRK